MDDRSLSLVAAAAVGGAAVLAVQRIVNCARLRAADKEPAADGGAADGRPQPLFSAGLPHPGWKPPQPQPPPFDSSKMHSVDPATTPATVMYPLVISAVVPRPIAFVSSLGAGVR